MGSRAGLLEELQAQRDIIAAVDEYLEIEPDDETYKAEKKTAEAEVRKLEAQLANLDSESAQPPASTTAKTSSTTIVPPPPPPPPTSTTVEEEPLVSANVGDIVLAKYSADKQYYSASVISKTGSAAEPIYTVKFKGYGNVETVRKNEIKAAPANKKRKADGPPATGNAFVPPPPPPSSSRTVISAAPAVDKTKIQKREPSLVSDGPTRMPPEPKKLKNSKALDKAKNKWNSWQTTGVKKTTSAAGQPKMKDSMFRTGDNPNARVGFVGSGKGMTKDPTRKVYTYEETERD